MRTAVCVAALMCFADRAPAIAKKARLVCEYGRCWQTGAGYDYQYGYRPPTKWEQKGFVLPVRLRRAAVSESSEPPRPLSKSSGSFAIFGTIRRASSRAIS